jgi:hypothetical protein
LSESPCHVGAICQDDDLRNKHVATSSIARPTGALRAEAMILWASI